MQNQNAEAFLSFMKANAEQVTVKHHNFGLQIDFYHENRLRSILFHYFLENQEINLDSYAFGWIVCEDVWVQNTLLVQSSIRANLGNVKKIHGRKTEIRTVHKPEAIQFFTEHHLSNSGIGKIRYGLFFENEMVALMCFSAGRNWIEQEGKAYELIRFCNHQKFRVQGGFSKLLAHFKKEKNPVQLMTFIEDTWYQTTVYEQFGFRKKEVKYMSFSVSKSEMQRQYPAKALTGNTMVVNQFKSHKYTWEA